ncbi:MAG: hypothetical protein HY329_14425 [Chloroflexi bacterium]|nr:hypothetical protein [Chloroflexota bacterium]
MQRPGVEEELGRIQELVAMELGEEAIRTLGPAPRSDSILVVTDGGIIVETGEPKSTEIVPWYYVEQAYKGLARKGRIAIGDLPRVDDPGEAEFRTTFLFGLFGRLSHIQVEYTPEPALSYEAVETLDQIQVRPETELPPAPARIEPTRLAPPDAGLTMAAAPAATPNAVAAPVLSPAESRSQPTPISAWLTNAPAAPAATAPVTPFPQPSGAAGSDAVARPRCVLCAAPLEGEQLAAHVRRSHDMDYSEYRRAFVDVPTQETWLDLGDGRAVYTVTRVVSAQ